MHDLAQPKQQWQAPHLIDLSASATRSGVIFNAVEDTIVNSIPTAGGGNIPYTVPVGPTATQGS